MNLPVHRPDLRRCLHSLVYSQLCRRHRCRPSGRFVRFGNTGAVLVVFVLLSMAGQSYGAESVAPGTTPAAAIGAADLKERVCTVAGPLCQSIKDIYWSVLGITNIDRWIPYLCAFAGAFLVYLLAGLRAGRTPLDALKWLYPRRIYFHRSAIVDYQFYLVLILIGPLVALTAVVLSSGFVAGWLAAGLNAFLGPPGALALGGETGVAYAVLLFLAVDFSFYWAHRLAHTVPVLWEFHKVHHAAEVLTPVTAARLHPVDNVVSGAVMAVVLGTLNGVYSYLSYVGPGELDPITLPGTAAVLLIFRVATIFEHTHIWVNWSFALSHVFGAPALHLIHHSCEPQHLDKNMGRALTIWDWMFGTLYVPRQKEEFRIGLTGRESTDYHTVTACYLLPFKKAARLIKERGAKTLLPAEPVRLGPAPQTQAD